MLHKFCIALSLSVVTLLAGVVPAFAQTSGSSGSSSPPKSKFEMLVEGSKTVDGMWKIYYKDQQLLVDLPGSHIGQNFIVLTSIAKGISRGMVLGGMSWGFGDDVVWSFAKVGDKIHVLRKNVRFKARPGTPEADATKLAYSDSVLYALPILSSTPTGGSLVDMTRIFMSDDQQIGRSIGPGFFFAYDRSTWGKVKAFPRNVELQVNAVYSGGGEIDTVADSRGVQVGVHYSISMLPSSGYMPRKADDRVGYFLTVVKDLSDKQDDQQFVRYINRWDLKKKDPEAKLSPPEKPIEFYMEKTVPVRLRPIVQAGIEEWNKAFEKFGYSKAIVVQQQGDNDDWDPEDVRYNTFRWITANAGFAMGPSRVNPYNGQILDADIIFDASFLQYWKMDYESFSQADVAAMMGGLTPTGTASSLAAVKKANPTDALPAAAHFHLPGAECALCTGMQQQMGFAAALLQARGVTDAKGKLPEEFINQGLKEVVMHEVGHTLGLRHNFKASTWKPLAEVDDPVKGAAEGTVASVMDYNPANIAPKGVTQGLYFPQTIGPYDYWAIEYGYKNLSGDEATELGKIAARSSEPGLDYATDEDTRSTDSDPLVNRFDLGQNPIDFARRQMTLAMELLPKVVERSVEDGQGYQRARQAFGMIFSEYWRTAYFASRYPGGIYTYRDHKDAKGRGPFKLVEVEKQRDAMKLLNETAFSTQNYPPEVLNFLAATRWNHWGVREYRRIDYPIHEFVSMFQAGIVSHLFDDVTLARINDSEVKAPADADMYTLAEHIRTLVDGIFSEWKAGTPGEYKDRKPYVSSFRRNLQRMTLKELCRLVSSSQSNPIEDHRIITMFGLRGVEIIRTPEDARTLARYHLTELDKQITALLAKADVKLDDYTRAHLTDCQERIKKTLNATVIVPSVD